MEEGFTCNLCGAVSDTGYFYCEKCHAVHRARRVRNSDRDSEVREEVANNYDENVEPKI